LHISLSITHTPDQPQQEVVPMTKNVEGREQPRGSGNDGSSGGKNKDHISGNRHQSHRTTRKGLRIFVGTANLSQNIPGK